MRFIDEPVKPGNTGNIIRESAIILLALMLMCFPQLSPAQEPPSDVIDAFSDNASLPILCWDESWDANRYSSALGVLVGSSAKQYVLTCEHAVSLKDSSRKTLRALTTIVITLKSLDGRPILTPAWVVYSDEKRDLALLEYSAPKNSTPRLSFVAIHEFGSVSVLGPSSQVLMFKYPNIRTYADPYPVQSIVSRVASAEAQRPQFLLDADLEVGQSGGPVYLLSVSGNAWTRSLVGIAQGTYIPREDRQHGNRPEMLTAVEQFRREQFALAISVEPIIQVLESQFNIR